MQDKLTAASVDLSDARQVVRVLCEHAATADPSTLAACQKVAALPASSAPLNESVDHFLKVGYIRRLSFVVEEETTVPCKAWLIVLMLLLVLMLIPHSSPPPLPPLPYRC